MDEEKLRFKDDKIYRFTPLPMYGDEICKMNLVMTKEVFIECYKKWIEPQKRRNNMDKCFICNKEIQRSSIPRIKPELNKIMLNENEEEHSICDACGNLLSIAFRMYEGNLEMKRVVKFTGGKEQE